MTEGFQMNTSTKEDCVRIGLVDVTRLSREAMCFALASQGGMVVVFAVANAEEVQSAGDEIDVLLFNTTYPTDVFGEGLTLDYWRLRFPGARIFMLSPVRTRDTLISLVREGIDGYAIRNSVCMAELVTLLRAAHAGRQALCREAQIILNTPRSETDLTRRELQAIRLLHQYGPANRKMVAHRMDMSEKTLNVHIRNICQKLDVSGTLGILEKSRELGLIEQ
jgi:DNA-binding NarL/FixJ family response regulator